MAEKKTDLRILKTYHALVEAFQEMLTKQSFDAITVNSLCETASIRRATFYKHFSDKLEFTDFAARCLHENINSKCTAKTNLRTYLSLYASNLLDFFKTNEVMTANLLSSTDFAMLMQILQNQIFLGIREKLSDSQEKLPASPEIVSAFYTSGVLQIIYSWLTAQRKLPEDRLLNEITAVINAFHTAE